MNNVFVYCETDEGVVAEVSLELLTKGRKLADELKCGLEAIVIGKNLENAGDQIFPFGVDVLYVADDLRLDPYTTLPHAAIVSGLFRSGKPQVALLGATPVGRDLGPRVSSALHSGLTADCTGLEIGNHEDKKENVLFRDLLYQIRPAFGGNIIATIINPCHRPQMATVREGVMKKEIRDTRHRGKVIKLNVDDYVKPEDFVISVIERHLEKSRVNLKGASIIVAGGYGMGSKENFALLYELAEVLGGEVGASRAAVDAGFTGHDRQIGQTGVTVRPKLYIAFGISGQIQHRAGMEESAQIIAVNTDPGAPINSIADYVISGDVTDIVPKMIKYYRKNSR
jgi:electron transfer flavoprotein alpha subunit